VATYRPAIRAQLGSVSVAAGPVLAVIILAALAVEAPSLAIVLGPLLIAIALLVPMRKRAPFPAVTVES
jgi:hypothetical protein